ncbi:predicted protein [Naegleria gruberi]|uniref:Predicted protein n=1 Tax=Naegleria gruberi TaxID=5762 RepID=D2W3X2_NAEGR|nr:uncharacterized protein NAEGRDRAFT_76098 [Naegleria gruberi]EFC36268.1 predicted protein [Naegleria gruberi]|eukprot:XP_002669012.1 predicted protein [Naegleria gruberi strain NEG-M]
MHEYYYRGTTFFPPQWASCDSKIFNHECVGLLEYFPNNLVKIIGREMIIAMLDRTGFAFVVYSERCLVVKGYSKLPNVKSLKDKEDDDEIVDIRMDNVGECNIYFHTRNGRIFMMDTREKVLDVKNTVSELHCYSKVKKILDSIIERGYLHPLDLYRYHWNTFKKVELLNNRFLLILTYDGEMKLFRYEEEIICLQNQEKIDDFVVSTNSVLLKTSKRRILEFCKDKFGHLSFSKANENVVKLPFEWDEGDSIDLIGLSTGFLIRHHKASKEIGNYTKEMISETIICGKSIIDDRNKLLKYFTQVGSTDLFVNLEFLKLITGDLSNLISETNLLDNLDEESIIIFKELIILICKLSQYPNSNSDEYLEHSNVVNILERFKYMLKESLIKNIITALALLGNISDIGLSLKQYLFSLFVEELNEDNVCIMIEIISKWLKFYPNGKLINLMMGRCLAFTSENLNSVKCQDKNMMSTIRKIINSKKLKKSQIYDINWTETANEKSLNLLYKEYLENLDRKHSVSIIINHEKTELLKVNKISLILASPVFAHLISQNDENEPLIDLFEFQKMLIENSTDMFYQHINMTEHLRFIILVCSLNPEIIMSMENFTITELVSVIITAHHFQMEKLFHYAILCVMNSNGNKQELELILEMINLLDFDQSEYSSCLWKFAITFSSSFLKKRIKNNKILSKILILKEYFQNT